MVLAYPGRHSIRAGDDLDLLVSSGAKFEVLIYRYGAPSRLLWRSGALPGRQVPTGNCVDEWEWPCHRIPTSSDWPSGVYIAALYELPDDSMARRSGRLARLDAREGRALFLVRSAQRPSQLLYKIPMSTYHAYNWSGKGSLYWNSVWCDGPPPGYKVTLRRPGGGIGGLVTELVDVYDPESPRQTFAHWDAPFITWLESNGFRPDYCTDLDLARDDSLLRRRRLVVSAGHDEYWTEETRAATEAFMAAGGNVAVFGGNTCFWRIHLVDGDTALICNKVAGASGFAPDEWSQIRPEEQLTGVAYRNGGGWWRGPREAVGYRVTSAAPWVFAGTGLEVGDAFGEDRHLVGYECDGARHEWGDDGRPHPVGPDVTPSNFQMLAVGELTEGGWHFTPRPPTSVANAATMGWYRDQRGGGVMFNAATTDWARVLRDDQVVRKITRNVMASLLGLTSLEPCSP